MARVTEETTFGRRTLENTHQRCQKEWVIQSYSKKIETNFKRSCRQKINNKVMIKLKKTQRKNKDKVIIQKCCKKTKHEKKARLKKKNRKNLWKTSFTKRRGICVRNEDFGKTMFDIFLSRTNITEL